MTEQVANIRLGDVITLQRGFDLPKKNRKPGNVALVSSAGISDYQAETKVQPPAVITGRYGTLGKVFYLEKPCFPLNTTLWVKDFKGNVPRFCKYLLETIDFYSCSDKAAVPGVNRNHLEELVVRKVSVPDQKAIAHILGTLDDKIELNQKMNQTLEDIAKAIFKSWFVDFDPVRAKAEGRPTGLPPEISDLFPEELVDSEIGEIPKGWVVSPISDFALHNKKTVNPSKSGDTYEHYSIPAFDSGQTPVLDFGVDIKSNKTVVVEGSLLVSKLNPNTPRIWLPKPKDAHEQICSTEFMVFTPNENANIAFLWGVFTSSSVSKRMEAIVTGTSKSHQRVKPKDVCNIEIGAPNDRLMRTYGDIVLPILNRTINSISESNVIAELRDTLLPKLISGELRIPDAEKFLEEAGV